MKKIFLYSVLVFTALTMIIPFLIMFLISLSGEENIFANYQNINLSLCAYKNVFDSIPVVKYFLNSLIVAFFTTLGQVLIAALAGYGFARLKFKGSDALFFIIILTMMVPPQVNIVPLFYLMSKLGWINTYQALIVPGIFGGFGVFMMRQYFLNFSKELEDASKLDGCNAFQTFFKIALPCAMPAIATLAIFTFVTTWNSFMWPLIVTNTDNMRTLAVGLSIFKGSFREITLWGELMACSCICSIPVILIFLGGKKYLLNNPQDGAIKE
ncbi:MAG: carbohydrate ABC transporter permease [Candidatus Gastranaerophilales bacterium]|nr:carbohydrate ABC transporter permease [Candidatus Gastranaerophilales bacterium]